MYKCKGYDDTAAAKISSTGIDPQSIATKIAYPIPPSCKLSMYEVVSSVLPTAIIKPQTQFGLSYNLCRP